MIAIIDYGRGNLFSIGQAMRYLGAEHEETADPDRILAADKLILPGVGAFGDAMKILDSRELIDPIKEAVRQGTPLLGICLGMQLLAGVSEEFGQWPGLDLIPGKVARLPQGEGPEADRIPNVGWRRLQPTGNGVLFQDLPPDPMFYFVHSYAFRPDDPAHVSGTIRVNGVDIPVAVESGRLAGFQFHPEKSGPLGLSLLKRFLDQPL